MSNEICMALLIAGIAACFFIACGIIGTKVNEIIIERKLKNEWR